MAPAAVNFMSGCLQAKAFARPLRFRHGMKAAPPLASERQQTCRQRTTGSRQFRRARHATRRPRPPARALPEGKGVDFRNPQPRGSVGGGAQQAVANFATCKAYGAPSKAPGAGVTRRQAGRFPQPAAARERRWRRTAGSRNFAAQGIRRAVQSTRCGRYPKASRSISVTRSRAGASVAAYSRQSQFRRARHTARCPKHPVRALPEGKGINFRNPQLRGSVGDGTQQAVANFAAQGIRRAVQSTRCGHYPKARGSISVTRSRAGASVAAHNRQPPISPRAR